MKVMWFTLILGVVAVSFLSARTFWPFPAGTSLETQQFFTIVTAIESLFLGFGLFFVLTVFTKYGSLLRSWQSLDWLTFISIAWILVSGYPHDNHHIVHETNIDGLISIEIIFHGTLAIAAIIVALYFLRQLKDRASGG